MTAEPGALVGYLLATLGARAWTLAAAESDTGGLLLDWLIARPGSSAVVLGGVVAYHDALKRDLLGVAAEVIEQHGAVSGAVAQAMAEGIRRAAGADLGLATTGIAGPGGATATKPVGLAYVAAAWRDRREVREYQWQGDRAANRRASALAALALAVETLP